jgi:hypothetical protein
MTLTLVRPPLSRLERRHIARAVDRATVKVKNKQKSSKQQQKQRQQQRQQRQQQRQRLLVVDGQPFLVAAQQRELQALQRCFGPFNDTVRQRVVTAATNAISDAVQRLQQQTSASRIIVVLDGGRRPLAARQRYDAKVSTALRALRLRHSSRWRTHVRGVRIRVKRMLRAPHTHIAPDVGANVAKALSALRVAGVQVEADVAAADADSRSRELFNQVSGSRCCVTLRLLFVVLFVWL